MVTQRKQSTNKQRRSRRNQAVTVSRSFLFGSLPAGNGGFQFGASLALYPDEATLLPIARSYSEYKFTRMQVTLQPRCSTTTQGSKWLGFGYSKPFTPADYTQAAALDSFSSSQAYGVQSTASLRPSNSSQRWYPVYQNDLTPTQLSDLSIVQAYLYLGTQSVQSGVVAADVHVSYTITFRGPVSATGAISADTNNLPKVINRLPVLAANADPEDDS